MTWNLKRSAQCAKCPWIKGVDPHDIPDGYCKYKVRRCMHDEEKTEGSSYDNALQEIINLLKSEKSSG